MIFPYIYRIENRLNGKVYIGKTLFDVKKRWSEHCRDCRKDNIKNRPLYAAMRKYGVENFEVTIVEECSDKDLSEKEKYWIQYYDSYKNGYNATLGGDGTLYLDYEKVINTYLRLHNQKLTAEALHISPYTVSYILKVRNIPHETSYEVLSKLTNKPINMLSLDGEFIKHFQSVREASKYIIKVDNKNPKNVSGIDEHIIDVCKGKRKTAYEHKWEYANTQ